MTPPADRSIHDRTPAVVERHRAIDAAVEAFAAETEIRCPPGCGACCWNPDVETTVTDALPMAEAVVARGEAASVLERLADRPRESVCVFYEPVPDQPMKGRCSMYAARPSICRLFGFSGRRRRDGEVELITCRIHKQVDRGRVEEAERRVAAKTVSLPLLAEQAGAVAALSSGPDAVPRPINEAFRMAIEQVALRSRLRGMASALRVEGVEVDPESDPESPSPRPGDSTPRRPRRAA